MSTEPAAAQYQVLMDWADGHKFPNLLTFVEKGRLAYLRDDKPSHLSPRAVQARVNRAWAKLLPILEAERPGAR